MADYSKIGYRLVQSADKSEQRLGRKLQNTNQVIQVTPRMLNDCDSVIVQNREKVIKLCSDKPLNNAVKQLNYFGDLAHKFQGLFLYKTKTETIEKAEQYFKSINMINLYNSYRDYGMDGVYTFLLNKQAAGTSMQTFSKVEKALEREYKSLGIDMPDYEVILKGLIHQGDMAFLPWKHKGFSVPKTTELPAYTLEAKSVTEHYLSKHRIDGKIPNGFRDGGRSLYFDKNGNIDDSFIAPYREILVVDKNADTGLKMTIDGFKSILSRQPNLTQQEKLKTLYTYVLNLFKAKAPQGATDMFPSEPIKIGSIIGSGAGCCRHMALVAKLLGDEIGIHVSLVRGKINTRSGHLGNHIWNEVSLPNGEKYLLDVAQRKLIKFNSGDDFMNRYYDVNKNKMY